MVVVCTQRVYGRLHVLNPASSTKCTVCDVYHFAPSVYGRPLHQAEAKRRCYIWPLQLGFPFRYCGCFLLCCAVSPSTPVGTISDSGSVKAKCEVLSRHTCVQVNPRLQLQT